MGPVLQRFRRTSSLLLFLFLFSGYFACAQNDSLMVVRAPWKIEKVAPGVHLKTVWFNGSLFHSNQNISILEIKMSHRNSIAIAAEPKERKTASTFGKEHEALAALNGTFFDMKNGGSVDYIRMDGLTLNESHLRESGKRSLHQKAAVVINKGQLSIACWDGSDNWEKEIKGDDVMVSGPLLLQNQKRTVIDSVSFCVNRHPRTAVAVRDNYILFITVDGRNDRAAGMSLFELSDLIRWLGANDAINLDGGGSTTLWVKGFPDGGVINHPSDNTAMKKSEDYKEGMDLDRFAADVKKWDHSGERPVANVLLLNKRK